MLVVEKALIALDIVQGPIRAAATVAGRDHRILPRQGRIDRVLHFLEVFRNDQRVQRVTGLLHILGIQPALSCVMVEPQDLVACEIIFPALQPGGVCCNAQTFEKLAFH